MKSVVVFGIAGRQLDRGGARRWERWRPTVDLVRHDDLVVDRLELIVDDHDQRLASELIEDIRHLSPETEVVVHPVSWQDPWDFEEVYGVLHELAGQRSFDPDREDYLVHITTGTHVAQICLFLLAESHHIPGRLLQSAPPKGRDQSAPGTLTTIDLDLSRYDRLARRFFDETCEQQDFLKSGIATGNRAFNAMIAEIEKVSLASSEPILLMGPTGAGKSQLVRRIYQLRKRRGLVAGELVEVNCATLRGQAAMSALFGHVRGAYTGANKDRAGLLRSADRGMLFLDEVGELGLDEQAMLLRAVEEGIFHPVGADAPVHSHFQLLAGTNRDLGDAVARGHFREDLYARINLWSFRLPGLADRPEDIDPNFDYELRRIAESSGRRVSINKEARRRLIAFATSTEATWPGNFRDFHAAVTRMATLAPAGRIDRKTVDDEIERLRLLWRRSRDDAEQPSTLALDHYLDRSAIEAMDRFDQVQLADVLSVCRQAPSLSAAGRILFSESRKHKRQANDADRLRKYLGRFGLEFDQLCDEKHGEL